MQRTPTTLAQAARLGVVRGLLVSTLFLAAMFASLAAIDEPDGFPALVVTPSQVQGR